MTTPHAGIIAGWVEQQEDHSRQGQPGDRGHHRNQRARTFGQFADRELGFDFQADDEEEERHQGVVDE
jgi:hypothetical protein